MQNQYIISKTQDRLWISGSAALSLILIFPMLSWPSIVPLLFWTWAFFFDGPHIWATYSRTYADLNTWPAQYKLYLGSCLFLVLPLAVMYIDSLLPNQYLLFFFLSFAMLWAYYHIIRQHYGFISLYDRKANATRENHNISKWCLYLGLWSPYLHLGLNHPINIDLFNLKPLHDNALLHTITFGLPILVSLTVLAYYAAATIKKKINPLTARFFIICLLTHSIILYGFAVFEPVHIDAINPAQYFMGITILLTLFHNVQYTAFVWHFNRNNSSHNSAMKKNNSLNSNFIFYIISSLVFSIIYVYLEWATGEYPGINGSYSINNSNSSLIALAIWWGFSMHHYYLDSKIWRPS